MEYLLLTTFFGALAVSCALTYLLPRGRTAVLIAVLAPTCGLLLFYSVSKDEFGFLATLLSLAIVSALAGAVIGSLITVKYLKPQKSK